MQLPAQLQEVLPALSECMQQLAAGQPVVPLPHLPRPGKIKCVEVEGIPAWVYPSVYPLICLKGRAPKLNLPHPVSRALNPGCHPLPERGSVVLQVKVPLGTAPAAGPALPRGEDGAQGTAAAAPAGSEPDPAAAGCEGSQAREDTPGERQAPPPGAQAAAAEPQLPGVLPGQWVTAQQVAAAYRRYHSASPVGVPVLTGTLITPMSAVMQLACWAEWWQLGWELVSWPVFGIKNSSSSSSHICWYLRALLLP